jgi:N-methylhydantoinase A
VKIGIDVGGTFTDIVCIREDGVIAVQKVSSTPDDYSRSITEALPELFASCRTRPDKISEVIHGTTVATNAILQRTGAATALITTKGFRDVLELRRIRMPELYNWNWDKPPELVERRLRREIEERIDIHGNVVKSIDLEETRRIVDEVVAAGVESIAICLINSYVNSIHEEAVARLISERHPQISVSISSEILREVKEYERTATVVVNAYVLPFVKKYVESLERSLQNIGVQARLLVMQSNGGVMSAKECARKPVFMIESGPAAGVISAQSLARQDGLRDIVTFDMGGTTTKASIIEQGQISTASEYEVGSSLSLVSRLIKGGGHLIRVPAIDVAEIGAGGGSIAWLDPGGALRIGPRSAGANPGPVCYDRSGTEPTITDANLVLGYINDEGLVGGGIKLNRSKAEEAIRKQIASPLGMELLEAAYGIHVLANSSMMRALRAVSTERGRDVRDFVLVAFGGSGPIHAVELALSLEMKQAVIPPHAGLFSACGLLSADLECRLVQTFYKKSREIDLVGLNTMLEKMETQATNLMASEGYAEREVQIQRSTDLRYVGQSYELTIPVPLGPLTWNSITDLEQRFEAEHEKSYGHRASEGREYSFVNFRVTGKVRRDRTVTRLQKKISRPSRKVRTAYFGAKHGLIDVPALSRDHLAGTPKKGPLLIDEYDTTTVVAPGCSAWLDDSGNIRIQIGVVKQE